MVVCLHRCTCHGCISVKNHHSGEVVTCHMQHSLLMWPVKRWHATRNACSWQFVALQVMLQKSAPCSITTSSQLCRSCDTLPSVWLPRPALQLLLQLVSAAVPLPQFCPLLHLLQLAAAAQQTLLPPIGAPCARQQFLHLTVMYHTLF